MKQLNISKSKITSVTSKSSEAFKKYLSEIRTIPVLTPDEEYELAILSQNGDIKAKDSLIRHNLRFVIAVAKQYETPTLPLEDLVNEGNIGLIGAAERFDPSRGFKFISYAVWWIRRNILMYINDHGKTIRLPSNKSTMIFKIKAEYDLLEQKLERLPNYIELVDVLSGKFTEDEVLFFYESLNNNTVSMDKPINSDESSTELSSIITNDDDLHTDHILKSDDSKYKLEKMLNLLDTPEEQNVIILSYGLDGEEPLRLKTIAFMLGKSSERIRQIKDKSIRKLKYSLRKTKIKII